MVRWSYSNLFEDAHLHPFLRSRTAEAQALKHTCVPVRVLHSQFIAPFSLSRSSSAPEASQSILCLHKEIRFVSFARTSSCNRRLETVCAIFFCCFSFRIF